MILTVDFGTSVTKVALWAPEGLVALARAEVATAQPEVGWAEQDPLSWWTSMVVACAEARAQAPEAFGAVDAVGCSGARQTFVPVTAGGEPVGRALVWSDHRATAEARQLAAAMGGAEAVRQRTGAPLDGGSVPAKLRWLARHEPGRLSASDWLLSPRDLVVWRLTGELATDRTLASRTGLYDLAGVPVDQLSGGMTDHLPPVIPPASAVGQLRAVPAAELGLRPGTPVVIGAGDRPSEVLGAGAAAESPMVSWGTTANVSVPLAGRPEWVPAGAVLSCGAAGGWLLEGGLSAAGSFLGWLGRIAGREAVELAELAARSPVGARGVVAMPWLDGARAPWWRDEARAGIVGLGLAHGLGDLARAVIESVACEVARCLEVVTAGSSGARPASGISLGGAGSTLGLWVEVLTSVTGLPARRRRSGEAASAGAALLVAAALDRPLVLDVFDPVAEEVEPRPDAVAAYKELRPVLDRYAARLLELADEP